MNLRIQITIQDKIGHTEVHPVNVDVEMLEDGPMIIDDVEREILRINRDVIRNTISAYLLEELSKKPDLRGTDGDVATPHDRLYAVGGEIGQFSFRTHHRQPHACQAFLE